MLDVVFFCFLYRMLVCPLSFLFRAHLTNDLTGGKLEELYKAKRLKRRASEDLKPDSPVENISSSIEKKSNENYQKMSKRKDIRKNILCV